MYLDQHMTLQWEPLNIYEYISQRRKLDMDTINEYDEQYAQFLTAAHRLASELNTNTEKIVNNRIDSRTNSYYSSTGEGDEYTFFFEFNVLRSRGKILSVFTSVIIYYNCFSAYFDISEDITAKNHGNYLNKLVDWTIYSFNRHRNSGELDALFSNVPVRVYGLPNDMEWTEPELSHFINGINAQSQNVLIYKIRHIDTNTKYRSFSYAFFQGRFWAFFLVVGGLDSGGAHSNLDRVNEMIENISVPVDMKNIDINYYELEEYLARRVAPFEPYRKGEIVFKLDEANTKKFGTKFSNSYSKFLNDYEDKDYVQLLRNLRALLQTAMEEICKQHSLEISKDKTIRRLCDLLVRKKIVDKKMIVWYCAFTSIANPISHNDYSLTDDDFSNEQLKIAILIGTQLISGLGNTVDLVQKSKENQQ